MSVWLDQIGGPDGIEIWAPDYNKERLWLLQKNGLPDEDRIDLTIEQAKELRDFLIEESPK